VAWRGGDDELAEVGGGGGLLAVVEQFYCIDGGKTKILLAM